MIVTNLTIFYQRKKEESILEANIDNTSELFRLKYIRLYKRNPPEAYNKWVLLAKSKQCFIDPSYYFRIESDLRPFRSTGISLSVFNNSIQYIKKVEIMPDGNINAEEVMKKLITPSLDIIKGKYIPILINELDEPRILVPDDDPNRAYRNAQDTLDRNKCLRETYGKSIDGKKPYVEQSPFFTATASFQVVTQKIPLFSPCKTECYLDIIFPGPRTGVLAGKNVKDIPKWEDKQDKVVWRGSTTGGSFYSKFPYKNFPRIKLAKWAAEQEKKRDLPYKVDVGIMGIVQTRPDSNITKELATTIGIKPKLSYSEQYKAKYLLVIDGNTWPSRLATNLLANSTIFLSTIFIDWVTDLIKPYVHYVPFSLDISDLTDKLNYIYNNQTLAKDIALKGTEFASQHLRIEDMQCYVAFLLMEYAQLLKP
jgi:hypothetical protein